MAVIEVATFRLVPGAPEGDFLEADRRVQTEFTYHRAGILRRTTARSAHGEWIVVTVWASATDAGAASAAASDDAAVAGLNALVDPSSVVTRSYHTLD
jgi:hypothetical protein